MSYKSTIKIKVEDIQPGMQILNVYGEFDKVRKIICVKSGVKIYKEGPRWETIDYGVKLNVLPESLED